MNQLWPLISFLLLPLFLLFHVEAQNQLLQDDQSSKDDSTSLQPNLVVVIGILCIMFTITFSLVLYAKFCHNNESSIFSNIQNHNHPAVMIRSTSRFSGIDKAVIESLPFFRFSSLRGSKEGLECAVCLSKFEDIEILRLLPKCKHAFHINCIDQWLEKHASCPLCRLKVDPEDPTIFTYSNSMRLMFNNSDGLFIQREEENRGSSSSRFSIGSSFRKTNKEPNNKEEQEGFDGDDIDQQILHKYNHKIIVSDVIFKHRWSCAGSSDFMFLNTELLDDEMSSNRFDNPIENNEQMMKIKEEMMEMKTMLENNNVSTITKTSPGFSNPVPSSSSGSNKITSIPNNNNTSRITIDPTERRAMSEISAVSRFQDLGMKNSNGEASIDGNERTRRLWLPIARRTVQWFADRQRRRTQQDQSQPPLDV